MYSVYMYSTVCSVLWCNYILYYTVCVFACLCCYVHPLLHAVKVLVMAGQLKRDNPNLREDVVLIRALRDSNLPKFLADDAVLFQVKLQCVCMCVGLWVGGTCMYVCISVWYTHHKDTLCSQFIQ